jgi:superfamily II DNA/RNA helicase
MYDLLLFITTSDLINFLSRNANLLKGIYEMGFTRPSKIQAKALPLLLKTPYVILFFKYKNIVLILI